jgi:hypothetical protein
MNRGQIFSMDLLASMIIIILGLGLLTSIGEINFYNTKQKQGFESLKQKTETALIILTNSTKFDCNIEGIELAYSIDENKINLLSEAEIKKELGLKDYNAQIYTQTRTIINDAMGFDNIASIDINIAYCKNTPIFEDINNCMRSEDGACYDTKLLLKTLTLRVGK